MIKTPVRLRSSVQSEHPIQGIMSRTGSFPLRIASSLIAEHSSASSVIFDPFCGKGTSLFAARTHGHTAIGLDVAPEAVIATEAKLGTLNIASAIRYIDSLPQDVKCSTEPPPSVQSFFHPITLRQVLSLSGALKQDIASTSRPRREHAIFTLACLLGILHGHATYSLSISSAHAYSMAPAYVARYAMKHNLAAPVRDVKSCLREKASRCLSQNLPKAVKYKIRRGSALSCREVFPDFVGKVDLVLTSPPYLNAQTYAKDNWLRLWLLGHDYKALVGDYIQTSSLPKYHTLMRAVFISLSEMLKPGGRLICIAGDVRGRAAGRNKEKEEFSVGHFLADLCQTSCPNLFVHGLPTQFVNSSSRYYHALSRSKGHDGHSLTERVFIAEKLTT